MLQWRILTIAHVMSLLPYLHRVVAGSDLSAEEAHQAMGVLLEGQAGEAEIAGFLVALKMKGETAAELAGFARAMRDRMIVVDAGPDVIDTCGTGGDGSGTFNISTAAAHRDGGSRRARRQARQPVDIEQQRKRGRAGGFGRARNGCAAGGSRAFDSRDRDRVSVRAGAASGDEACAAGAAGAEDPHGVQSAGPAGESGAGERAVDRSAFAGDGQTDGRGAGRVGNAPSLSSCTGRTAWTRSPPRPRPTSTKSQPRALRSTSGSRRISGSTPPSQLHLKVEILPVMHR